MELKLLKSNFYGLITQLKLFNLTESDNQRFYLALQTARNIQNVCPYYSTLVVFKLLPVNSLPGTE